MSKEKLQKVTKYVDDLKSKLSSEVPEKHKDNPVTYKNFLDRELRLASKTLENLKLTAAEKK